MASLWHLLLVILPILHLVASFKLPNLRFSFQDGNDEENVEVRGLHVQAESPLSAPGWWEWKTGGDTRHELLQQPRRKRRETFPAPTTISTQTPTNNTTGVIATRVSTDAPAATAPMITGVVTKANTTEAVTGSTPTTDDLLEADATEGVTSTGTIPPQNSSSGGTGRPTVAIKEKMEVTTGKGPLEATATSRAPTRTSVGTLTVSTATPRQSTAAAGPYFRARGTVRTVSTTAKAASATITTNLPAQKSLPIPSVVGKCLLAIFLLALVAGIFIVVTTVLATLLWRQKRAYKLNQHNHTEMVCISSLLAPEEMEEAGGRHPRVRRARMLGENASEAEMDNLTLNSFLPDH